MRMPEEVVELSAPATRLTLVIEGVQGSEVVQKIIVKMRTQTLAEIAADPEIEAIFRPMYERHLRSIDINPRQSQCEDGVIFFDLVEQGHGQAITVHLRTTFSRSRRTRCR